MSRCCLDCRTTLAPTLALFLLLLDRIQHWSKFEIPFGQCAITLRCGAFVCWVWIRCFYYFCCSYSVYKESETHILLLNSTWCQFLCFRSLFQYLVLLFFAMHWPTGNKKGQEKEGESESVQRTLYASDMPSPFIFSKNEKSYILLLTGPFKTSGNQLASLAWLRHTHSRRNPFYPNDMNVRNAYQNIATITAAASAADIENRAHLKCTQRNGQVYVWQ